MIAKKSIHVLVVLMLLFTSCASFQVQSYNTPQQIVDEFMYLISQKMDFSRLIALGDYPSISSQNELNFYLLDMRKLIPYEEYSRNSKSACGQFEKQFKYYYDNNQLVYYANFKQDRQSCINEMNQLGNKIIPQVYNLISGIKFINSTYNDSNSEVLLEYRSNSDNRKIIFPLVKKNGRWYFKDFSYQYIVNRLGYL